MVIKSSDEGGSDHLKKKKMFAVSSHSVVFFLNINP